MNNYLAVIAGLLLGMLSGCAAMVAPQNPDEFRARIPESYKERHHIKRPYRVVADVLAKKARECLNISFRMEWVEYNGPYRHKRQTTVKYKSTMHEAGGKTVLAVQYKAIPKLFPVQNEPPDGIYAVVVDAYPSGNGTQLDIYGLESNKRLVPQAIKHWANGTNMGCPDLSTAW